MPVEMIVIGFFFLVTVGIVIWQSVTRKDDEPYADEWSGASAWSGPGEDLRPMRKRKP